MNNLSRLAGFVPISTAVLMLSFWIAFAITLPMQEPYLNWVLDADWTWVNLTGFIASSFGVLAWMVIFSKIDKRNKLDYFAYGIGITGIIILTCILFFEAFILKGIALERPELIDLSSGFYQYPVFRHVNLLGGIFLTVSILLLGIKMISRHTFKKWKVITLMIACPMFGIVYMPGNVRLIGVLLYAIAFFSLGLEILNKKASTSK